MGLINILLVCLLVKTSIQRPHQGLEEAQSLTDQSELHSASRSNDIIINQHQDQNADRQDNVVVGANSQDSVQGRQGFGNYYLALQKYADRLAKFPMSWSRRSNSQRNQQAVVSGLNSQDSNAVNEVNSRLSSITKHDAETQKHDFTAASGRLGQLLRDASNAPSSPASGNLNALQNEAQLRYDALSEASSRLSQLLNREASSAHSLASSNLSLQELQNEALSRSQALDELTSNLNEILSQANEASRNNHASQLDSVVQSRGGGFLHFG